jgi:hypothetical protein
MNHRRSHPPLSDAHLGHQLRNVRHFAHPAHIESVPLFRSGHLKVDLDRRPPDVFEHCITEARSHDLKIDIRSARGDVADKGFCVTLTDLPVPSPLIPLGHQNVAPEILQDLVDLDRFPKHLPVHVQLSHRTRRRTEKVAAVPRQGNVRED